MSKQRSTQASITWLPSVGTPAPEAVAPLIVERLLKKRPVDALPPPDSEVGDEKEERHE